MNRRATRGRRRAGRQRTNAPKRGGGAVIAGGLGELMLTAGAMVLLFVVYTLWGTGIQTANAQDELRSELNVGTGDLDKEPPSLDELELGDAYGIIRIPRFGDDWGDDGGWVIVEGTKPEDLKNGPGHYPESADPGEFGNFAVAAHRSGHGNPFAPFPDLHVGDIIEIETAAATFTYQLDDAPDGDAKGNKIPTDAMWVVAPVPGEPEGTEPAERRITLTTCYPLYGSSERMYATGLLVGVVER